jgi:iron complex outermembrane receptor protein
LPVRRRIQFERLKVLRGITIGMTALAIGSLASPLAAQTAPPSRPAPTPLPDAGDDAGPDVVVEGNRLPPGSVVGDIPPEHVLSPADIRSYGVSSLSDLLTELAPQTRSDRGSGGAPVVLLNGRRISSFAEIRDIPTEAIARVDILPEEVALKYGYTADQRVVNVVLRRRFRAVTMEGADTLATDGGRNTPTGHVDGLKIAGDTRINVDLNYSASDPLFESERNLTSRTTGGVYDIRGNVTNLADPALNALAGTPVTFAGVPASAVNGKPALGDFVGTANKLNVSDLSSDRTLLPSTQTFSGNVVYSRPIGKVNATINARVQTDATTAYQGLPGVAFTLPAGNPFSPFGQTVTVDRYFDGAPLVQRTSTLATHLGVGLNGSLSPKWRWSFTGNYDRSHNETFTETGLDPAALNARLAAGDPTFNPFGPLVPNQFGVLPANRAYSTSNAVGGDVLLNGPLFKLPAGAVSTAVHIGAQATSFDTRSVRGNVATTGALTRNIVNGQINIDVPLTGRRNKFLDAVGDLSLNGNLAVNQLSDFGTLWTIGYGANWSPIPSLRLIASFTDQNQAPSSQQLGNPVIVTPNVRVFDYVLGQTADVTQTSGGNTALISSERHVFKLGATFKPSTTRDLTFTANYVKTGTDNPIAGFPSDTPAIEAAFPGRFTRAAPAAGMPIGVLTQIDTRPVNFLREDTQELRYGFNVSFALKSKLQKQFEAFRAGKGPNPFTGLAGVFGRRPNGAPGSAPNGQGGDGQRAGNAAPPPGDGAAPGGPPPSGRGDGQGGGRPGGGGFGGRGGGGGGFGNRLAGATGGRLQFALYHTWHFVDRVTVAQGIAPIDRLNGGATGSGGGQSRHEIEGQAGYSNNGLGFRLSANWQSATRVTGGTAAVPNTLNFGSLAKFDVRLFDDLTQNLEFLKKHHWAKGMRIGLAVTNILNTRQRVTDQNGEVPLSYQGAYLDSQGRAVRLTVRKLIF